VVRSGGRYKKVRQCSGGTGKGKAAVGEMFSGVWVGGVGRYRWGRGKRVRVAARRWGMFHGKGDARQLQLQTRTVLGKVVSPACLPEESLTFSSATTTSMLAHNELPPFL